MKKGYVMLSVIAPVNVLPTQPAKQVLAGAGVVETDRATSHKVDATPAKTAEGVKKTSDQPRTQDKDPTKEAQIAAVIQQLKQRDQQVRAHEMAHLAAAGAYATSAAQYVYQTGPDGRKYAIGGEVGIDLSPERDAEATIRKMQTVQRAALAPADPSPQDMRVAAQAAAQMMQAQQTLQKEQVEKWVEEEGDQAASKTQSQTDTLSKEERRTLEKTIGAQPILAERHAWEARNRLMELREVTAL